MWKLNTPIILAVDDNANELELIRQAAAALDITVSVLVATDEQQALALLQTHGPRVRVVVLDVHISQADGRWLFNQIHEIVPDAQIVPFTVDRIAIEHLRAMGSYKPIHKPVLDLQDVTTILDEALHAGSPAPSQNSLQSFIAAETPRVLHLMRMARSKPRVGLVTGSNVIRIGLVALIEQAGGEVINDAGRGDIQIHLASGQVGLVVCTLDRFGKIRSLLREVPLLVYATAREIGSSPSVGCSVLIEPVTQQEFTYALHMVAIGEMYQSASLALSGLSEQSLRVVHLAGRGWTIQQIADELHVSYAWARHLCSRLYAQLNLSGFAALQAWAQHHPFDLPDTPSQEINYPSA